MQTLKLKHLKGIAREKTSSQRHSPLGMISRERLSPQLSPKSDPSTFQVQASIHSGPSSSFWFQSSSSSSSSLFRNANLVKANSPVCVSTGGVIGEGNFLFRCKPRYRYKETQERQRRNTHRWQNLRSERATKIPILRRLGCCYVAYAMKLEVGSIKHLKSNVHSDPRLPSFLWFSPIHNDYVRFQRKKLLDNSNCKCLRGTICLEFGLQTGVVASCHWDAQLLSKWLSCGHLNLISSFLWLSTSSDICGKHVA